MGIELSQLILVVVIICAAGFIQGFTGFGSGLLALPLLSFILDIKLVVPLMSLVAVIIGAVLFYYNHTRLNYRLIGVLVLWALIGVPIGTFLLTTLPTKPIELMLAILLMIFAAYSFAGRPLHFLNGKLFGYLGGFLSGLLGSAAGVGGPPIILYASAQSWSAQEQKNLIAAFLFVTAIIIACAFALSGLLTETVRQYFAISFIPLVIATLVGIKLFDMIHLKHQRQVMSSAIFLLGVLMLIQVTV